MTDVRDMRLLAEEYLRRGWPIVPIPPLMVSLPRHPHRKAGLTIYSSPALPHPCCDSLHPILDYMAHGEEVSTSSSASGSRILKNLIVLNR